MKTRSYQIALAAAVAVCIALGGTLAYVIQHRELLIPAAVTVDNPVIAHGSAAATQPAPVSAPGSGNETPISPIQLSPQRLQEIGITTAAVTLKDVNDNLNVPGNVEIDEKEPRLRADTFSRVDSRCLRKRHLPVRAQGRAPLHHLQPRSCEQRTGISYGPAESEGIRAGYAHGVNGE